MTTVSRGHVARGVLAAIAMIAIGAAATQAADPFAAGQPSTEERPIPADRAADVAERARAVGPILGVPPGAVVRTERIVDRFEGRETDRAIFETKDGRGLAVVEFDDAARLHLAFRLGTGPGNGPKVRRDRASELAAGFAAGLGFAQAGRPLVHDEPSIGGWSVLWPRLVDGVAVRGDGIRVGIGTDGSFDSFARWEHPLAAAPSAIVAEAEARAAAERWLRDRLGSSAGSYSLTELGLTWVAPNDTWDPARPDAPDAVRRLAWVARADASEPGSASVRALQVWLDAGDLSVIGGDVAR